MSGGSRGAWIAMPGSRLRITAALAGLMVAILMLASAIPAAADGGSVAVVKYTDLVKSRSSFYYETKSPCGAPIIVSDASFFRVLKYHPAPDAYKKLRGNHGIPVDEFVLSRLDEASRSYILDVTRGVEYDKNVLFIFVMPGTPQSVISKASSAAEEAIATYGYDKAYIVIADHLEGVPDDVIHGEMRPAFEDATLRWVRTVGVDARIGGGYSIGLYTVTLFPVGGMEALGGLDSVLDLANHIYEDTGACIPINIAVMASSNPNRFHPATGLNLDSEPSGGESVSSEAVGAPLIGLLSIILGSTTALIILLLKRF